MASARAPKQWCLSKTESVNSFESWRQNLQYILSLDQNFAPFLVEGTSWQKKSKTSPLRGFIDDDQTAAGDHHLTAHQKVTMLELMLGQIANYCPVIARNIIVKNSTSVDGIWQTIRTHYGFQSTGAHFIDFSDIHLEPLERPEDLYQRLLAFIDDNLLQKDGGITHHGESPSEDEEQSPSLENIIVLTWLRLIHKDLPHLVKQRYGTELRSKTLASIKPEISQALDSLLDELKTSEDTRIMRTADFGKHTCMPSRTQYANKSYQNKPNYRSARPISCPLCKQSGRSEYKHFLSSCKYLPESDRKFMTKARQVLCTDDIQNVLDDEEDNPSDDEEAPPTDVHSTRRVQTKRSPTISAFYNHYPLNITIDSGAETNMIRVAIAKYIGAKIDKSSQIAVQADGHSPLTVVGETVIKLSRDDKTFVLEALVVENLDVDILGGVPFMSLNDIAVRPAKCQVLLSDGTVFNYDTKSGASKPHSVRRTHAHLVRAPVSAVIWPGEFLEVDIPTDVACEDLVAVEPRTDSRSGHTWPHPHIFTSVGTKLRIPNDTVDPKVIRKNDHVCQILPVFSPAHSVSTTVASTEQLKVPAICKIRKTGSHSSSIRVDPDGILTPEMTSKFLALHNKFDNVFNPEFSGYNGAAGPFQAVVNMGPVQPPQRKGRIPQYSHDKLVELQNKFDDLERLGVFRRPEDAGVVAEYLNPSFLVKKPSGSFRLVTAFADVGRYSKPQPSLLPDVDSTLRSIARWKYLIVSDLTSAFFQIPLSKDSMRYCGVATPFRGVRVYTRAAMGMPGSETALEELMTRVLGDLLQEGVTAKLADDLYCGGDSPEELLYNWTRVLQAFQKSDLRLSASKTVIAPKTIGILGWIWSQGRIHASQHRIATLSTCAAPNTVHGLRSFIGAYKVLARVLPDCATLLAPLEDATAGRQSRDKLTWSDELYSSLTKAQKALSSNKTIVLPNSNDAIWIVTDGAVKSNGIGATLYVMRDNTPLLAGFFSAKLRKRQVTWLPCEIEALSITAAVKHFSPYIIQSKHGACVLTDSKPCVQAFEKLARGEFSASPRVTTFLTTVSRYQISIRHLAGSANMPSDFASRNAPDCYNTSCQICRFIALTEDSVVRHLSVQDVLSGDVKLPFTNRSSWSALQLECPDLRRTHAHLVQGTRPSKKLTKIRDVKRYLNAVTISSDGLLVAKRNDPMAPTRECIVIPRQILEGLLAALHIKLDHPTYHQLRTVVHRYFYALDMDKAIDQVCRGCHLCASLKKIPKTLTQQTTSDPPGALGVSFAADVIKRERQLIFVIRETVTSFTSACLIDNERGDSLRDAIIRLCIELRALDGPIAVVRTDPAPGFVTLRDDELLRRHRICIEIGRIKNTNKNPVAEKAVQEVEEELLRQDPAGGAVSALVLSVAIARLNSRTRIQGLSAREMWFQRDQFTNSQLPICDRETIVARHQQRIVNHPYSERSKAPFKHRDTPSTVDVGDLVYLSSDRDKSHARARYIVISVEGEWCNIRKFSGSQLRAMSYRVKRSNCYSVPAEFRQWSNSHYSYEASDDESDDFKSVLPPVPAQIPQQLSVPGHLEESAPAPDLPMLPVYPSSNVSDNVQVASTPRNQVQITDVTQTMNGNSPVDDLYNAVMPRRSMRERHPPKYLDSFET